MFIVHKRGPAVRALNGCVKINLAKFILVRLNADDCSAYLQRNIRDHNGRALTINHFRCVLHQKAGRKDHEEFLLAAGSEGNLSRHASAFHTEALEGMARVISEHPKEEAIDHIQRFLQGYTPKSSDIRRMLKRMEKAPSQVEHETSMLLWFLDARIAFDQFDNPLFKQALKVAELEMASSTTIVNSVLPFVYHYVTAHQVAFLDRCASFWVSFDSWKRLGLKFLSQHYHCITLDTFEFKMLFFNMAPFDGPGYAENFAAMLAMRQNYWIDQCRQNKPFCAGMIADGDSKGQAGAKLLHGDEDVMRCQQHLLKKVYEVGEANSGEFCHDFLAFSKLASEAALTGNMREELSRYQRLNELTHLRTVLHNATRWESRFVVVQRAVELRDSLLSALGESPLVQDIRANDCADFLFITFFERMQAYLGLLAEMNEISELWQTQRFPTGLFVPLCVARMCELFAPTCVHNQEPGYLHNFKTAFRDALKAHMFQPVLGQPNNWLKASLFHPELAKVIIHYCEADVIRGCWKSIYEDVGSAFVGEPADPSSSSSENDEVQSTKVSDVQWGLFKLGIRSYRILCGLLPKPVSVPWNMPELKQGKFGGVDALAFWASVAQKKHPLYAALNHVLPVAAMYLAIPAGEAVDECVFSAAKEILTPVRSRLAPTTVEQLTVIRVFLRRFGMSLVDFNNFVVQAKANAAAKHE